MLLLGILGIISKKDIITPMIEGLKNLPIEAMTHLD